MMRGMNDTDKKSKRGLQFLAQPLQNPRHLGASPYQDSQASRSPTNQTHHHPHPSHPSTLQVPPHPPSHANMRSRLIPRLQYKYNAGGTNAVLAVRSPPYGMQSCPPLLARLVDRRSVGDQMRWIDLTMPTPGKLKQPLTGLPFTRRQRSKRKKKCRKGEAVEVPTIKAGFNSASHPPNTYVAR